MLTLYAFSDSRDIAKMNGVGECGKDATRQKKPGCVLPPRSRDTKPSLGEGGGGSLVKEARYCAVSSAAALAGRENGGGRTNPPALKVSLE